MTPIGCRGCQTSLASFSLPTCHHPNKCTCAHTHTHARVCTHTSTHTHAPQARTVSRSHLCPHHLADPSVGSWGSPSPTCTHGRSLPVIRAVPDGRPVRVSHLQGHNRSLCSLFCDHIVNLYLLHFSATVARGLSILLSFSKEPALCFIGFLCRVSVFNSSISVLRFVCFLPHDLGLFCSPFSWWSWRSYSFLTLASGVPHVWLPFPFWQGAMSGSPLFLFLKFLFKLKRD